MLAPLRYVISANTFGFVGRGMLLNGHDSGLWSWVTVLQSQVWTMIEIKITLITPARDPKLAIF